MSNRMLALLFIAAMTVGAVLVAGCTQQDAGTSSASPQESQGQVSPAQPASQALSSGNPSDNGGQQPAAGSGRHGQGPQGQGQWQGSQNQTPGQTILSNATRVTEAAQKLGVTEQQLRDALSRVNATTGRSGSLTDASQALGVSPQQLRDALGFTSAGRPNVQKTTEQQA